MKVARSTAVVSAVVLLLASSSPVVAQDVDMHPAAVLGWALNEAHVADGASEEVDSVLQRRGPQYSYDWVATDPRLVGHAVWTGNGNRFRSDPFFEVQRSNWEVSGEGGSWIGEGTGLQGAGLGEQDAIILTGQGAYEGLTAYLVLDWSLGGGRFRGAIFPGEMPPQP